MNMIDYDQLTSVIGCFCTLLFPYRGQTEETIDEDYGTEVIVRLNNGREKAFVKDEVIIYD